MSLTTPEKIRTLQRKLYRKACRSSPSASRVRARRSKPRPECGRTRRCATCFLTVPLSLPRCGVWASPTSLSAASGGHQGRDGEAAMATNRTPLQRTGLALNHEQEMSLRYGELASHFAFASEEERREAWFYHRDRLLQHCSGGQRPAGWWDYECPIRRPRDRDYEEAALLEAGLLTEDEVTELTSRWRQHFERAQQPGFVFCVGFAKP